MSFGSLSVDKITDSEGSVFSPSSALFRNRIINGDMRIDQRNAGASVTPTVNLLYLLDRWQCAITLASKFSVQQNAGSVTPPQGFTNYLGITSLSAYSILAGDVFAIRQNIEGFNVADLDWGTANAKTVTLSFWVRSSLTGTFGGSIKNSGGSRSYPFSYSISSADTWEYKTITIAGDTNGTWLVNNGVGVQVVFSLGTGSDFSSTAGAWAGANYNSSTGATSVVGTDGATFYITGVQLEVGSVATPFERRPFGTELQLCYRYFRKTIGTVNTEPTLYAWGSNAQVVGQSWIYPVPMRTSATVSTSGSLAIAGGGSPTITADANSYFLYVNNTNAVANVVTYQPNGSYQISFSAEL